MLSAAEHREFDERGILRLAGLVDPCRAAALREEVLALVAARQLVPESPQAGFAVSPSRTASVPKAHGFEEIWGARTLEAIDDLLGAGAWHVPKHAGQLLAMTWPLRDTRWELPHKAWHFDYPAPGAARDIPGLQLFLCVDRVEAGAGATLVAAGTPRIVDRIRRRAGPEWPGRSADARGRLRREAPWFDALCSLRPDEDRILRFMSRASDSADGSLRVVELTGDPGDVWAMHPWTAHDASPNCGARPRMALTERIRARRPLGAELVQ